MKKSEKELYKIIVEAGLDTAMGVFNVLTFGVAMNITDFIDKVIQHQKGVRDTHYALQIQAFLETPTDLTEEQFKSFMKDNPDNQRLGLEIFKILEQTVIEEQAKMLARAFSLWVQKKYENRRQFDRDVYLIKSMDSHLLNLFREVGELHNDGVDTTYDSQHLEHLNLVVKEKNPIQNSSDKYEYKASQLGREFYERIVKNRKEE